MRLERGIVEKKNRKQFPPATFTIGVHEYPIIFHFNFSYLFKKKERKERKNIILIRNQ